MSSGARAWARSGPRALFTQRSGSMAWPSAPRSRRGRALLARPSADRVRDQRLDDGAGGFYVHAWEWGPHDALHATMWSLDAEGRGPRLGCDPLVRSIISGAAVGPDGIYAVVTPRNPPGYWSIVKIAR